MVEIGSVRENVIETLHGVMGEIERVAAKHMVLHGQAGMSEEEIAVVRGVAVDDEVKFEAMHVVKRDAMVVGFEMMQAESAAAMQMVLREVMTSDLGSDEISELPSRRFLVGKCTMWRSLR